MINFKLYCERDSDLGSHFSGHSTTYKFDVFFYFTCRPVNIGHIFIPTLFKLLHLTSKVVKTIDTEHHRIGVL